jgi:hypothetical protein
LLDCLTTLGKFLAYYPVLDLGAAVFWGWAVRASWQGWSGTPTEKSTPERQLGATVILAELNGVIIGASVIMVGVGAFVAINTNELSSVDSGRVSFLYAAIAAVIALGVALYTMAILPTRTRRDNLVKSSSVALLTAMALFFVLDAGTRFVIAVLIVSL